MVAFPKEFGYSVKLRKKTTTLKTGHRSNNSRLTVFSPPPRHSTTTHNGITLALKILCPTHAVGFRPSSLKPDCQHQNAVLTRFISRWDEGRRHLTPRKYTCPNARCIFIYHLQTIVNSAVRSNKSREISWHRCCALVDKL